MSNIFDVFDEEHNLIKEYEHWKLLVGNRPFPLGYCVLIIKRPIERFSDATPEEFAEYGTIVKEIEHALKTAFNYDKINWLMLMMQDKQVHFHIVPRYAQKRDFAGRAWLDAGWPKMPTFGDEASREELDAVKEEIRKHLT